MGFNETHCLEIQKYEFIETNHLKPIESNYNLVKTSKGFKSSQQYENNDCKFQITSVWKYDKPWNQLIELNIRRISQ